MDHIEDWHKHYRMAITSVLYNECFRRRCVTKKCNAEQVDFYNNGFHKEGYDAFLQRPEYRALVNSYKKRVFVIVCSCVSLIMRHDDWFEIILLSGDLLFPLSGQSGHIQLK